MYMLFTYVAPPKRPCRSMHVIATNKKISIMPRPGQEGGSPRSGCKEKGWACLPEDDGEDYVDGGEEVPIGLAQKDDKVGCLENTRDPKSFYRDEVYR